jgi:CRP-like cAMP-binding protein
VDSRAVVSVLDEDPDLGDNIRPGELAAASVAARAMEVVLPRGAWPEQEQWLASERGAFGLLLLDGIVCSHRSVAGRSAVELVGPGDLLQPWVELGPESTLPQETSWTVLAPARAALLDRGFSTRMARWPEIAAALMHRQVLRIRRLAVQLAVCAIPSADERVLLMLWALADRWGIVTPRGVELRVPLTHDTIAHLVGARRPSVTVALSRLRAAERVTSSSEGWRLLGEPPAQLQSLREHAALPPRSHLG